MISHGLAATWPRWWHTRAQWAADADANRAARRASNASLVSALAVARGSEEIMTDAAGAATTFPANTLARLDGVGAFIGGAATNYFQNPRMIGANLGPITTDVDTDFPDRWHFATAIPNGLSAEIVDFGEKFGLPYFALRYFGTPTVTTNTAVRPELFLSIPVAPDEAVTHGWTVRLAAAATAVPECFTASLVTDANNVTVLNVGTFAIRKVPNANLQRWVHSYVVPPTGVKSYGQFIVPMTAGVAVDFTLEFYPPVFARGIGYDPGFVLPPAGVQAVSTRAASDVAAASFGWFGAAGLATGFSFLVDLDLDHVGDGVERHVFDLSDGTDNERATLRLTAAGTVELTTARAGVTTVLAASAPALAVGAVRLAGRIVDGQSRLAVTGRAPIASAAAPIMPAGLDRLRIGARWNGGGEFNDVLRSLQVPRPLGDADMDVWVAS